MAEQRQHKQQQAQQAATTTASSSKTLQQQQESKEDYGYNSGDEEDLQVYTDVSVCDSKPITVLSCAYFNL